MTNVIKFYKSTADFVGVQLLVENVNIVIDNKEEQKDYKGCLTVSNNKSYNCINHVCTDQETKPAGGKYGSCTNFDPKFSGKVPVYTSVTNVGKCCGGGRTRCLLPYADGASTPDSSYKCPPKHTDFDCESFYCYSTTSAIFGDFNGDKTVLFGKDASNTLIRPYPYYDHNNKWIQGTTWAITDELGNGNIWIIFGGRKDLYENQDLSNPIDMIQYLSDIYSMLISDTPILNIDPSVPENNQQIFNTIRDKFIPFCFINDWYRQLYDNKYKQPNIISNLLFNGYTLDNVKNLLYNFPFNDFYTDNNFPTDFKDVIHNAQKLPFLSRSENPTYKFKITFSVSYDMYNEIHNTDEKTMISSINKLIQYFFGDSESKVIKNNISTIPADGVVEFENNKISQPNFSGIVFPIADQSYKYVNSTLPTNMDIITDVSFDIFITKWSPMMYAFFSIYKQNIDFSPDELDSIKTQIGLYPVKLFNNKCPVNNPLKDDCYNTVAENCSIYYNPPRNIPSNIIGNYIMCTESGPDQNQVCLCWSSRLSPSLSNSYGDRTSMCFSRLCDNGSDQTSFNLTKEECKSHCNEMWERLHSPNPATRVRNISELSDTRLSNICGPNYVPDYFNHYKFNKNVLLNGLIIIFIISIIVFLYINTTGFSVKKLVIAIVSLIFSISIIIFMSYDLNGKSICKGKKQVCQSKITKIGLPDQFCPYITDCECTEESDCQNDNCICISGTCIPKSGSRQTTTVKRWNIQYVNVILCVILSILLPILFYQIVKKFKPTINNIYLYSIIGIITIIPLAVIFIFFLKQEETLVFAGDCKCVPTCNGKCDMSGDGCGGTCSTCPEDKVCYNKQCCSPVCDGKTCGEDQCGNKCKCPTGKKCQEGNCINDE